MCLIHWLTGTDRQRGVGGGPVGAGGKEQNTLDDRHRERVTLRLPHKKNTSHPQLTKRKM